MTPWCLNTTVDYGNEQYKSNSSYFIKLICLKFQLVLTKDPNFKSHLLLDNK